MGGALAAESYPIPWQSLFHPHASAMTISTKTYLRQKGK